MTNHSANPFSTRFTRPGAIPPLDERGDPVPLREILSRFGQLGGIAAIVGAHGSGKSTLLMALARELARESRLGRSVRLGRGWWKDAINAAMAVLRGPPGAVAIIDSWERLGPLMAVALHLAARILNRSLLVTAHAHGTIPTLVECRTTAPLLVRIVQRLHPRGGSPDTEDVVHTFEACRGDIREALFALYDHFEASRHLAPADDSCAV
jgi:ABC-type dipeptide/oligopeptide/nickel transport system ATPase component